MWRVPKLDAMGVVFHLPTPFASSGTCHPTGTCHSAARTRKRSYYSEWGNGAGARVAMVAPPPTLVGSGEPTCVLRAIQRYHNIKARDSGAVRRLAPTNRLRFHRGEQRAGCQSVEGVFRVDLGVPGAAAEAARLGFHRVDIAAGGVEIDGPQDRPDRPRQSSRCTCSGDRRRGSACWRGVRLSGGLHGGQEVGGLPLRRRRSTRTSRHCPANAAIPRPPLWDWFHFGRWRQVPRSPRPDVFGELTKAAVLSGSSSLAPIS